MEYLIKGLALGVGVSVPLGPLGLLLIQRTINKGFLSGLITGVGASFADLIYAIIAGLGIAFILNFIEGHEIVIRIIGATLILILGIKIFFSHPAEQFKRNKTKKKNLFVDFISSFFLTITNPATLFIFGAAFAAIDLSAGDDNTIKAILIGVFVGAMMWWLILAGFVSRYKHKFKLRRLWWMNKITGGIIFVFGMAIFLSVFLI